MFISYLVLMALITFACRYFFFSSAVPNFIHPEVKRLLMFAAPSVLTAMWVPIVFIDKDALRSFDDPYFMAGMITIVLSILSGRTLVVILLGMLSFGLLNAI